MENQDAERDDVMKLFATKFEKQDEVIVKLTHRVCKSELTMITAIRNLVINSKGDTHIVEALDGTIKVAKSELNFPMEMETQVNVKQKGVASPLINMTKMRLQLGILPLLKKSTQHGGLNQLKRISLARDN